MFYSQSNYKRKGGEEEEEEEDERVERRGRGGGEREGGGEEIKVHGFTNKTHFVSGRVSVVRCCT